MKAGAIEFLTKPFRGRCAFKSVRMRSRNKALLGREEEIQTLNGRFADLTSRARCDGIGGYRPPEQAGWQSPRH